MNADDIARAIVAGAKVTGADPIDVAMGNDRSPGYPVEGMLQVSRARAYAGRALDRLFNRPITPNVRPVIARLIGVNKPSLSSFFSSLDSRPTPWWDEAACRRVISVVQAGLLLPEPISAPAVTPAPPPVISPGQRLRGLAPKPAVGTLDRGGFRPAPDTVKKVLQDDAAEKRFSGPYVPVGRPAPRGGDDFLRRAVENTQKLTPPPED